MITEEIDWNEEIINSKDIIARHEELTSESENLQFNIDDLLDEIREIKGGNISTHDLYRLEKLNELLETAKEELINFDSEHKEELINLEEAIEGGENSPDWIRGESLISEDYFEDYIRDKINETYEMPAEFESGKWPWCHMMMDWESAAEDAKGDYNEIEISGNTFYIRS